MENPNDGAEARLPSSHVVVDTRPIEAEQPAPSLPTIDASIYCMIIDDTCARIVGRLSIITSLIFCSNVISLLSLI